MRSPPHSVAIAAALGLLLLAGAIKAWPILPIDETRYVGVAWEMWLRGDFLVPHLNGREYSHKPPLLFWLIDLGWAIFGVNAWWPRVVPALFALGSAALVAHLARVLWPEDRGAAWAAPIVLQASGAWMLFTPVVMFDIPLAFCALLGVCGIARAWRGGRGGWLLCGLGIGLGVLAKGPVVLLHVLPPALLAPYWMVERRPSWGRWYAGVAFAFALGAAIALSWAIPAAMRASPAYGEAIFWGQSANRMVHSFAHARPLYWYLPFLPLILLPWTLWPRAWRAVGALRRALPDSGVRLCLAWIVTAFVVFSVLSGKQVHYLLPLVPPAALLVSRALSTWTRERESVSRDPFAFVPKAALAATAVVTLAMGIWMHTPPAASQDVSPIATRLKALEVAGTPVAHVGTYQDQYHFVGRIERPFTVLRWEDVPAWVKANPDGRLVVYFRDSSFERVRLDHLQRYRGHHVGIADGKTAVWLSQHGGGAGETSGGEET